MLSAGAAVCGVAASGGGVAAVAAHCAPQAAHGVAYAWGASAVRCRSAAAWDGTLRWLPRRKRASERVAAGGSSGIHMYERFRKVATGSPERDHAAYAAWPRRGQAGARGSAPAAPP